MAKSHAGVAASLHHTRTSAHRALSGQAPHTRKSHLTHAKGALVVDIVTGQEGVIVSGKKIHVPTESPRG